MARPFQILPVLKVKVVWTVAIVFISWSVQCQGQVPTVDCSDGNDDLILRFPSVDFPGLTASRLKIAFQPDVTPECNPSVLTRRSSLDVYIIIPKDGCGTRRYLLTDDGDQQCYKNQIEYYYYDPVARENRAKLFPLVCCKPYHVLPHLIMTNTTLVQTIDYQAEMNFYQDESLAVKIAANPYTVNIGTWLNVGISVHSQSALFANDNFTMVITKCTLDPTGHPDVNKSITILDDSCPVDSTVLTTTSVNATTEYFRLKVCKWFGYSVVYVSCRVRLCVTSEGHDPLCDKSCPKSRRRRHVRDVTTTSPGPTMTVSKSFVIINAD